MKSKIRKRIGSILLCAALVLGSISTNVYVEAGTTGTLADQEDVSEDTGEKKSGRRESASGTEGSCAESDTEAEEVVKGTLETKENTKKDKLEDEEISEQVTGDGSEEGKASETISGNDLQKRQQEELPEEQYHFVEEDLSTVKKWLDLYCPNGFEDLLAYDADWWGNLRDYEKEYVEFLLGLIVELEEDVYEEQELSECIEVLESGVDAEDFFKGTVFQEFTLEDLKALEESGGSLEELAEKGSEKKRGARAMYALETGNMVAKVQVSPTGYSGKGHGTIYRITLGGVPAICISFGKSCRNSYLYHADPGTYVKRVGHLGYFASHADVTGATYVACQIAAWLMIESENLNEVNVKSRAQAMLNISSEESMEKMLMYVWSFYSAARSSSYAYYEYRSDHPNAQLLIVYKEAAAGVYEAPVKPVEPEKPDVPDTPDQPKIETISKEAEVSYSIEVNKSDWQTGVGLAGCEVEIFENGDYLTTLTTDENGHVEYSVEKTAEFSASYDGVTVTKEQAESSLAAQEEEFKAATYTYSTSEITAPTAGRSSS